MLIVAQVRTMSWRWDLRNVVLEMINVDFFYPGCSSYHVLSDVERRLLLKFIKRLKSRL